MPKSKKDQKVSLTKTTRKGLVAKQNLIEEIRKCVGQYKNVFVFSVGDMRNSQLKILRGDWRDSRFFFGKNKVMCLGLGRKREEEVEENCHLLSAHLKGQCGLLFTDKPTEEVQKYFSEYVANDFARSGFIATETVTLPAGPLEEFPFSMEPQLRELGLPTSLQKGVVTLLSDHTVCKEGEPLKPEQARILKLLQRRMATFQVNLICSWSKDGTFQTLSSESPKKLEQKKQKKEKPLRQKKGKPIIHVKRAKKINKAASEDSGCENDAPMDVCE